MFQFSHAFVKLFMHHSCVWDLWVTGMMAQVRAANEALVATALAIRMPEASNARL
jgi:hypothetical protein